MSHRFRVGLLGLSSLATGAAPVSAFLLAGLGAPLLGAPALAASALAAPAETAADIALPPGALKDALYSLAQQTGAQIVFTPEMVAGRSAPAIQGRLTTGQALSRLIAGSGLEMRQAGARVWVLRVRDAVFQTTSGELEGQTAQGGPPATDAVQSDASSDAPIELSEIVVGSHIRGVKDGASPVIVLSREDLDQAGRASVAEALAALPQAFNGKGTEGTISTAADSSGTNSSRGNGVNLRGFGTDATLVLVNGRRMAGTGLRGDFADVSSIPMAAVERIEILLDGASALYGSDAVGGVVNIVLKKRFDGAETRILAGGATRGAATQWSFGQTVGQSWDSGNLVVAYEHSNRDRLAGRDRAVSGNADLRRYGGTDRRRFYSSPGNIMRANAVGALVPAYAIPAGQNGVGLTPSSFQAGVTNWENQLTGYDVLPRQRIDAIYAALNQDMTPALELSADARATRRHFTMRSSPATTTLTVNRNNPYFVSPTGAASERIAYSFLREAGGQRIDGVANTLGVSAGGQARLPKGWRLDAYGAYALEEMASDTTNLLNSTYLSEALGTSANSPLTAFSTAADGYFNPFIGAGSNPARILDFVLSGYAKRKTRAETKSANLKLDGSVLTLPAGPVGVAVGGQVRREGFKTSGLSHLSGFTPTAGARSDVERTIKAVFAEVRIPLFGGDHTARLIERLELSAAVRREDYGHGVDSTDPKLGLIWSPAAGLTVKGSYGRSFRAPALLELNDPQQFGPTTINTNGRETIVMMLYGGNPDLKPETATSKALTLEWAPPRWEAFRASITGFDTRYTNRIGQPGNDYINLVLTQPEFAPFVTFVSPATNAADRARVQALIDDPRSFAQGIFPTESYGAIIDGRYVNTGALHARGIDLSAQYRTRIAGDPLALTADLSWLMRFDRKITPGSRPVARAGFVREPADFRARYAAIWSHEALTTTASITHVGDFSTDTGGRVKAWTTADLNLRYAFRTKRLEGLAVALNVQNLFDSDPPFYDATFGVGYDATNASPVGRVVSLQLTKAW